MTDKPFNAGRKYVDSGFVHDITDIKTEDHYFVQVHVWPSMKTDFPHTVMVVLSVHSGAVIHASCSPCKVSQLGHCSHIVAALLSLVDHVKKHGSKTMTACTSKDCTWNKGKKRKKNPQRLSSAQYPTNKKSKMDVIDFDPRPEEYRKVTSKHINKIVFDLQRISDDHENISMWETQLYISYEDYKLQNTTVLKEEITNLIIDISPTSLMQIEGTEAQSNCDKWHSERWLRTTASTCLEAYRVGKKVIVGSSDATIRKKDQRSTFLPTFGTLIAISIKLFGWHMVYKA